MVSDEKGLYILSHSYEKEGMIEELFERFSVYFTNIATLGFDMIYECPCEKGCGLCLYYPYHARDEIPEEEGVLRKDEFLKFLGKVLGGEREILAVYKRKFREGKLTDEKILQEYYELIKEKVLRIFEKHFDLMIKNPASIKVSRLEKVLGHFIPEKNLVEVRPMKEIEAIWTIAHEYAHNWHFENKEKIEILNDTFIVEGFAQWVSLKVFNFLYRLSKMKEALTVSTGEYQAGPEFFIEVENRRGMATVLGIVKGEIEIEEDEELKELLEKWKRRMKSESGKKRSKKGGSGGRKRGKKGKRRT